MAYDVVYLIVSVSVWCFSIVLLYRFIVLHYSIMLVQFSVIISCYCAVLYYNIVLYVAFCDTVLQRVVIISYFLTLKLLR